MYSQEGLTEIRFDPIRLMMYIVIIHIIIEEHLAWIPPKSITAMIVYCLESGYAE